MIGRPTIRPSSRGVDVEGSAAAIGVVTGSPVPMPDTFKYNHFNSNSRCDMLVGPCACGAFHNATEWVLVRG